MKAWTCPACGRGVAPGVQTCDHGGTLDLKGREFVSHIPAAPFFRPGFEPMTPVDPWAPGRYTVTD